VSVASIAAEIRRSLRAQGDPVRKAGEQRYFKETIRSYGVNVPKSYALARDVYRHNKAALSEADWFALAERLLAGGWFEEGTVGLELIVRVRPAPNATLFRRYERWLGACVGNWGHCDKLCSQLIGDVLLAEPALAVRLLRWTRSRNRWMRRGAAVSLVVPARRGRNRDDVFAIAQALLEDGDDLVQKGYGWMLKEASREHRPEVAAFLMANVSRMPRTAFRYAIEKFPDAERRRLMALS
jgi:3-methyladenine DNA glycosylase AlkD